jgi:hypothetical protein
VSFSISSPHVISNIPYTTTYIDHIDPDKFSSYTPPTSSSEPSLKIFSHEKNTHRAEDVIVIVASLQSA